jgi:hypothetical protein
MLTMPLVTMRLVAQERKLRTENSSTRFRQEGYPGRPSALWRMDGHRRATVGKTVVRCPQSDSR